MASPPDRPKSSEDDAARAASPGNGAGGNGSGRDGIVDERDWADTEDFGLGSLLDPNAKRVQPPPAEGSESPAEGNGDPAPTDPAGAAGADPGAGHEVVVPQGNGDARPADATVATPEPADAGSNGDGRDASGNGTPGVPSGDKPAGETGDEATPGDADSGSEPPTARELAEQRAAERRALKEQRKQERRERKAAKPRMRKLRFLLVLLFLGALALVSWVFGVMMAVTSDLPELEARAQYERAENSFVTDRFENRLVTLTGNERRILVESEDISPLMKQAVVAIEDERFYEHRGIDYMGMARALQQDILAGSAVQGGSTITQQFVKTALEAQQDRTVLQKLKEAALAYQIERQWSKDKILTNYLNNIYFGNGAYGIEAAARTYFGANHPGCGTPDNSSCAAQLRVEEAAMLAGMISSPTAYDPVAHPEAAVERRNVVLDKMRELGTLEVSDTQMESLKAISAPARSTVEPPSEDSASPYFTEWLRQQIVDRYGAGQAFGGGLEVESTLDLDLQQAAEGVVSSRLSGLGPTAAVVVIENGTGKVRAMVGGLDYDSSAFNIATNGLRQPGSSFKPFTLVTALDSGISPDSVWTSQPVEIPFEARIEGKDGEMKTVNEIFAPKNYDDSYLGPVTLTTGTTYSDNSVYAQVGMQVGPDKIADMANKLGIQSKVPHNPAMILGGLKRGVTPLEMAYAYSTLANDGNKISGTMASRGIGQGPVGIESVKNDEGDLVPDNLGASGQNEQIDNQVLDPATAQTAKDILHTVVTSGTGKNAQVGDDYIWGKTGTTDGNIDAWFVGANESVTAAVWVGYPDGATPMETEYGGAPVDGGTIPALIWHDVITAYDELQVNRLAEKESGEDSSSSGDVSTTAAPVTTTAAPVTPAPAPVEEAPAPAPAEPAPTEPAAPAPTDTGGGSGAVPVG